MARCRGLLTVRLKVKVGDRVRIMINYWFKVSFKAFSYRGVERTEIKCQGVVYLYPYSIVVQLCITSY